MAGTKQIRIGRLEKVISDWEKWARILEKQLEEVPELRNHITETKIKTIYLMVDELKQALYN